MAKNHDIETLECKIKRETDQAVLVQTDTGEAWLPKSQIEFEYGSGGDSDEIQLPAWLAIDKGLV